jgi:hypothetical protein
MSTKNDQYVWAYFETPEAAEGGARAIKDWDKANKDIKLGAIGVLHTSEKGKIVTKKFGAHNLGRGAGIGLALGALAALLPAVTLVGGAVGGSVMGGALGGFSKKGLGLSDEDLAKFKTHLDSGKALLIVMCDPDEVIPTKIELEAMGSRAYSSPGAEVDTGPVEAAVQETGAMQALVVLE